MRPAAATVPGPRRFGAVNWRGVWSLYRRDVVRFFRYAGESIAGPAVSSLLFLAVFELALGGGADMAPGVSLARFVAPGIVMFALTHSAFENAAIPILYDKLEGMIGDIVGAPLTPLEIVAGYTLSATSNALTAGAVVLGLMAAFVDLPLAAPAAVVGFAAAGAMLFALLGVVTGLWAERWDNYSAAETFLMLPLGLLSGAFFAVEGLPADLRWVFEANPVFHAVEGFRYGFIGHAQASIGVAAAVLAALIAALGLLAWRLFVIGYRIKP
ncbi:MAG: ABC transporter permease [Kiloniellaceae bacterium]